MSGEKSADLCWGQRYVWLRHQHLPAHARHESHIVRHFELPQGVPLAAVRTTLNYLVRRHEALRTTYHFDADADPWQRVHPPAPLPVVTVSMERDGTATPAEVVDELARTEFELTKEWPIRACVITRAGTPKTLVLVLNHMAFDAWSVLRFEQELAALGAAIAARRPAALEPVRHQPLDLARFETSVEAAAAKERAAAFWREDIAGMAADTLGSRRGPRTVPVVHGATLTSPALLDASRRIAERHQVWPSLVHVAAYTATMAAYTGSPEVTHLSFAGNRGSGRYSDVMTCAFAPLLTRVDCQGDPTFGELLRRVARRFDQVAEHTHLPYDELLELLARESFRRGEELRTGSELNFLSHATQRSNAKRTKFGSHTGPSTWAEYGADSYFRIYELRDAVALGLDAMSTVFDADAVRRFLFGHEAVVLAHDPPGTDLRLTEMARLIGFDPARANARRESTPTPDPAAERILAVVVRQANRLDHEVDTSGCYTVAGGRTMRVPRVLALLRDHGWGGVGVRQFLDGTPLRTLAGRLTWLG
ncbi:condensation domain-containing protein [Actinokineospora xionganensis]|uniref:Condensation domain-containing protein n=1 Tax=Actinokineospora xionganensis TaxID=2684470 RepID=A0ABR7L3V9_9PSEU|nr:condensation domain-containing protein [Actinokineospora xionganensis]MBC6447380.1 hypothetical protein [Actinokineospora xionganensis]